MQEVIGALAGWFNITAGGIFRIGDRIQMAGVRGDVIDITPLRTKPMEIGTESDEDTWVKGRQHTGRMVAISNKSTFTEPVYNFSSFFDFIWEELHILAWRSVSETGRCRAAKSFDTEPPIGRSVSVHEESDLQSDLVLIDLTCAEKYLLILDPGALDVLHALMGFLDALLHGMLEGLRRPRRELDDLCDCHSSPFVVFRRVIPRGRG